MTWFKVDDTLAFHHKTCHAGTAAMGLWVRAGAWSAQMLTDGFVPRHMVMALSDGDGELAARLVGAGLWLEQDDGFVFHDWSDQQPSSHTIKERRRRETERKAAWRAAQQAQRDSRVPPGHVRDTTGTDDGTDVSVPPPSHDGHADPDPTRPDPTRKDPSPSVGGSGGNASRKRSADPRGSRLPSDWQPSADDIAWFRAACPLLDGRGREITEEFRDYWLAKAGKDARKVDWSKTWRNWMRRRHDDERNRKASPASRTPRSTGDERVTYLQSLKTGEST